MLVFVFFLPHESSFAENKLHLSLEKWCKIRIFAFEKSNCYDRNRQNAYIHQ